MSKAEMGLGIVGIALVAAALVSPWWTFILVAGLASLRAPRPAPMMPAPGSVPGYPGYPMPPQQAPPPPPPYQQP